MSDEEDIKTLRQLIREYERKPKTQIEFFIKLYEEKAIKNLLIVYEKQNQMIDLMAEDIIKYETELGYEGNYKNEEEVIKYFKERCHNG